MRRHINARLRLGLGLLWLRHAWTFNWAHKPLCGRFRGDVLRVGRLRICRSCTLLYAGMALAAATLVTFPVPAGALTAATFGALALTVAFSAPPVYRHMPRPVRDCLRFAAGALVPAGVCVLFSASALAGATCLAALVVFWRVYFRLREARKLRACDGCRELGSGRVASGPLRKDTRRGRVASGPLRKDTRRGGVCSGFAVQAECARRYERAATELVTRSGYVPAQRRRSRPGGVRG